MAWLHNLVKQFSIWWHGLTPGAQDNVVGGVIAGIILAALGLFWKEGTGFLRKLFFRKDKAPRIATREEADGQREAMLRAVETAWIKGVLEKSLYEEVLISLNVQDRHDLIQPPVHLAIQTPDGPLHPLPPSADILDVFDENGGRLLILGNPGSGKTITLLDLARKLIDRARENPEYPLPVVFNLASWAEKQQPLDEWLIDELENKYLVPKPLGRYWVEQHEILLLLDGLDEVREDARGKCIEAINAYCDARTQVVVCSRRREYEAASTETRLSMWRAILLQPLSEAQIFAYLEALGEKAEPVRKALKKDRDLLELAQTPLLLNVMLMTYGGKHKENVAKDIPLKEKRSRLFDRYIHHVLLERGSKKHPWAPSQVMKWLRWIARGLMQHNETQFRLENLQPDWLPQKNQPAYKWTLVLIYTLLLGLPLGLMGVQMDGLLSSLPFWLLIGLIAGLWSKPAEKGIIPIVDIQWNIRIPWKKLIHGLIAALTLGLAFGLFVNPLGGLFLGIAFGLFVGLTLGMEEIASPSAPPQYFYMGPNQPIWQSGRSGLILRLLFGLLFGLLFNLILVFVLALGLNFELGLWLVYTSAIMLVAGVIGGSVLGWIKGVDYGENAFIRHWSLRFTLWRYGYTPAPWKCVKFLDYAAQRILLRRVGGGWIFIHRLIMEHIAQLDDEFIASLDKGVVR